MSLIASLTNTQPVASQPTQHQAPKSPNAPQPPADTVKLSKAAQSHLSGGDVDHDGDSH
jgi:hypothetical protein